MTNLIDPPQKPHAALPFATMAQRITDNVANPFAGAFVIMPPSGDKVELLLLSDMADDALFWGQLKAQVDIALGRLAEKERQTGQWGR